MTPRTPLSLLSCVAFTAALLVGAAVTMPRNATAQDTNTPVTLRSNPVIQADRAALLREEFRERQREVKEGLERFRKNKHPRGKKAELAVQDRDFVGNVSSTVRTAQQFGIHSTMVAPTNVKANNKTGDAAGAGQAEQSIAFLGLNGVCAWNDGQGFNRSPQDVQSYGWTTDGGATWQASFIPLKQGTIATWSSDPVVSVNEKTADFYYCGLTTNTGTSNNGVAVMRGHFAGGTFLTDASTQVAAGPSSSQGFDKEWVCADSSNGNIYVTYTLFTTTGDAIWFSRSTNNGGTWSAPLQISKTWENGNVSGSRPMVGPNGEVYVLYSAIGPVDADSIKIAKSTDAGVTFAPSVVCMTEYDNYFTGAPGFNRGRAVTFGAGAVDRSTGVNRGRVYTTVHDCVNFYGDGLGGGTSKSEVENNGNFANATPFTINQTLRGALSAATELDNWKFSAVQGQTYIFFVDSVRTTTFKYTMRIYCPNDTVVVSRLALSSDGSSSSSTNVHALIVWTAPTTNTYFLRMQGSTSTGGYRIRTGVHTPVGSDVARDTRDVMVASSADGVTGWSARKRVNDDNPLYDNWLPEVAVPCDGNAYSMWFDWRDTPNSCFGGSNIYMSRSTDAGATWAPNVVATDAVTANWTQVASNIAPNEGDYNGIYGGDCVALAFADGRLGDADVFTARLLEETTLSNCPGDQTVLAGTTFNSGLTINNLNQLFGNTYNYTITINRNWPGFPASGTTAVGAASSGNLPFSIPIPDSSAHLEVVRVCVITSQQGACADTCCFNLTVINPVTGALASLASSTAEPGKVSLTWLVDSKTAVNAYRSTDGLSWSTLGRYTPDAEGMVKVVDTNVTGGTQYSYRLGVMSGGTEVYAGQTSIVVPVVAEFALHSVFPNPATTGFSVSFSLMTREPATLEVFDLGGRRVLSQDVSSLGIGRHTFSLERQTSRLPVGVYGVRLVQGGRIAKAKISVIR